MTINHIRVNLVSLLFVSLFFLTLLLGASSLQAYSGLKAYRINFDDQQIARKFAISYHHALLETAFEQGYVIADLNPTEVAFLKDEGFSLTRAEKWQVNFENLWQQKQQMANSQMAGIAGFECYATVEETMQQALQLNIDYPQFSDWIDIGDSWQKVNGQGGYNLMVLKMTNESITGDKPILFIHSAMHAREYAPGQLTLDFASMLLNGYQDNADIRWLLDHQEIHILFHMNPDGRKIAETQILQRKNMNTNHCSQDTVGVDLNRNFAFTWGTVPNGSSGIDCEQDFRGSAPESEPETQAVSAYIRSIFPDRRGPEDTDAAPEDTAGMHLDIHSFSELVLWPFGHTNGVSPNNSSFVELGNKLAWYNNYTPMQSVGLYPTDGTSDDVSYGELGVAALTFELGTSFFQQCSVYDNQIKPDNLASLLYAAKVSAAPYQLAFGPEVTAISLNGSENGIDVSAGNVLQLWVTASALQTRLTGLGRGVSAIEYTIDEPIWSDSASPLNLTDTDGNLNNGQETMGGVIDTSNLAAGEHILYARARGVDGKPGVASAVFINIGANNSPVPEFSIDCNELSCQFDATSSTDSDGQITDYQWTLSDGTQLEGVAVEHTFTRAGNKQITLAITDDSGAVAQKSSDFSVDAPVIVLPPVEEPEQSSGGGSIWWLLMFCGLLAVRRTTATFNIAPGT